jgi:hypothetical protein
MECLGLHNKPKADVHLRRLLTGPKEEEEDKEKEDGGGEGEVIVLGHLLLLLLLWWWWGLFLFCVLVSMQSLLRYFILSWNRNSGHRTCHFTSDMSFDFRNCGISFSFVCFNFSHFTLFCTT